jgi:hypothetical protein
MAMKRALAAGARLAIGVDHADYSAGTEADAAVRDALIKDLAI